MATKQINLRLSDELLTLIDTKRGLVPRNAFIVDALSQVMALVKYQGPEDPLPKAERSPEPTSEIHPGTRSNGHRDTCRCLSCARLSGTVD